MSISIKIQDETRRPIARICDQIFTCAIKKIYLSRMDASEMLVNIIVI